LISRLSSCFLGAALGFAQELVRYVVGQATGGDRGSIQLCRDMVLQLNSKMIEFDFRNGPIRRKYDGLKYAIRKIEEVIYELSLLDESGDESDPVSKRLKAEPVPAVPLIDAGDLDAIRARYETYDKLREEVIKLSRDVQKLSKQAIFSVHRGDPADAKSKCTQALGAINVIFSKMSKVLLNYAF